LNMTKFPGRKITGVNLNSGDLMGRRFNGFDLKPHLEQLGVSMRQLVYWNRQSKEDFVEKAFDYPASRHITRVLNRVEAGLSIHSRLHAHSWTLGFHKSVREADILHLHIIHDGYFSFSALPYITRNKPTVWTWHDPWPMTGHCLHPLECPRYRIGCGQCPDLARLFSMKKDKTASQFSWKDTVFAKTKADVIVASSWMLEMAAKAPLARHFKFHHIPFGLNLDRYTPGDREAARQRFGITPKRPVLFLRAISSPYKGLSEFKEALNYLPSDLKLSIIVVQESGHFDKWIGHHQIIENGWTNDEQMLIDAYTACDFFVMPSRAESFGMMAIEAMACARPVVSFADTSVADITFAPHVGVCAAANSTVALARAIEQLARNLGDTRARGLTSRLLAEDHYDIRIQAQRTAALYRDVIKKRSRQKDVERS